MFDPTDKPRIFGIAPGADFPAMLVQGLRARFAHRPPEDLARVQLIVNTHRMERRIRTLFDQGPACLLPRIELLTDFGRGATSSDIPPAVSPLRRRFELIQLISNLLRAQPDLAARASLYDLADSLAGLMDEMNGEGVSPDTIDALDVSDQSGHWERAKSFFAIARHFLDNVDTAPDTESRQRLIVEKRIQGWVESPPENPVILAGSTGSRGTTMLLMQAISNLPQGAVVLPGYDFDMPHHVWSALSEALHSEDHPQFRFRKLLDGVHAAPSDVTQWHSDVVPSAARNRLVSLALRPAPVTDQWLSEGPALTDIPQGTQDVTLLQATSLREEALAISMRLRQAAHDGQTAALISPDRMLTRQVTASLDRWGITPDDSAGIPLQLTPPGRFLRHVSSLFQRKLTSEALLTLLKHPLCHSGHDRNEHLLHTRDLELAIRKAGVTYPDSEFLLAWATAHKSDLDDWISWVVRNLCDQELAGEREFSERLETHIALSETLAHGAPDGSGGLWNEAAGREAAKLIQTLRDTAEYAGPIGASDYSDLFGAVLGRGEVRDRDKGHPHILIWGTLEARVQGAEMVILGGLNEGSWPESPSPDPWLNRKMRHDAGLLLPERRIGLAAHDFQQAIGAPEVWLSRSIRSDEAQTVPSRWVNRLTNLLSGLPDQGGVTALEAMTRRGDHWLSLVRALEHAPSITPALRPSPRPPKSARLTQLSVTEIKRLIRDPYAIYARHVLKLRPLDPLMKTPDALLRGIVVHDVLEQFVKDASADPALLTHSHLTSISETVLAQKVPWPTARALWSARLDRVADYFIDTETTRRNIGKPIAYERSAQLGIADLGFTLVAKADRIDRTKFGDLVIYDYKTGTPPSKDEQTHFDKQLLLEAAMAEQGGFRDVDPADVASAIYLGLGPKPKEVAAPLEDTPATQIWSEFSELIAYYADVTHGFTARRAMQSDRDEGQYDQLARFGEWDATDPPNPEDLS